MRHPGNYFEKFLNCSLVEIINKFGEKISLLRIYIYDL